VLERPKPKAGKPFNVLERPKPKAGRSFNVLERPKPKAGRSFKHRDGPKPKAGKALKHREWATGRFPPAAFEREVHKKAPGELPDARREVGNQAKAP